MVPWNHFSIHKSLLEEVEDITDFDQLKQVVRTLIRENYILARKTNTVLKSLENQNSLIKFLHETLFSMMDRNMKQTKKLWAILGSGTLRTLDDILRYQMFIYEMANEHILEEADKKELEELMTAAFTVPYGFLSEAREKCVAFLEKIKNKVPEAGDDEDTTETEISVQQQKPSTSKFQNNRVSTFSKNRKQRYREMAKKKACRTSQKHSFIKSQNSKSESSARKKFTHAKPANSGETSQSDTEDVQPKKFPRRRRLKRKAEEMTDDSVLNMDDENSVSVNKTPVKKTEPLKKMRSSDDYSTNESVNLKKLVIKLSDFMIDPSADDDEYISQYKQAYVYKDNEENEYEVVDEAGDDVDSDHRAESDRNSDDDDQEDRASTISPVIEDNNEEETLSKSAAFEDDNDVESSRNAISNGLNGHDVNTGSPEILIDDDGDSSDSSTKSTDY